jgi:hypothetical protein
MSSSAISGMIPVRLLVPISVFLLAGCLRNEGGVELYEPIRKIGTRMHAGDMDGREGLLFFPAGDTSLVIVYDTAMCGLYMAWKGRVLGPARAPDGSYAPQGPLYLKQADRSPWTVRNGEDTLAAEIRFLGFLEDTAGSVVFRYALDLPGGGTVTVEEDPSWDNHYGDNALVRDFRFQGIDSGISVSVLVGGGAGNWSELWALSAAGELSREPGRETLTVDQDGVSSVKVTWEKSADP